MGGNVLEGSYVLIWKILDNSMNGGCLEYDGKALQGIRKFGGALKCAEIFALICPMEILPSLTLTGMRVTPKK